MWQIALVILGTIILLIASSITVGNITYKRRVRNEVKELFEASQETRTEIVTEEDIRGLPEPVQRCLRHSQIIEKERTRTVRLIQKGSFRQKEDGKWMPYEAEQYYTTDPPGFIWSANVKAAPFLSIRVRDKFYEGKGNIFIKLLGLIRIGEMNGPEVDRGTLARYLNEMMWFPSAYLNDYVQWEPIDSNSARASISCQGVISSAVLHFNEKGELTNSVAERYRDVGGHFSLETWSTPISEYDEKNGIRMPVRGEGVWSSSSGDFSYIRLDIADIEYNNPSMY